MLGYNKCDSFRQRLTTVAFILPLHRAKVRIKSKNKHMMKFAAHE
jgi:hypothetical protein